MRGDLRGGALARLSVVTLRDSCKNQEREVKRKYLYVFIHHIKKTTHQVHYTARAYARIQGSVARRRLASAADDVTAFLKIDHCGSCGVEMPWEWVPAVEVGGRRLAGTGVWRSTLINGLCVGCHEGRERKRWQEERLQRLRKQFIRIVGGVKPYREFTLERYEVAPGNKLALEQIERFGSSRNLYLWGPCGVGKTHLAVASLRRCFASGGSIALITPSQLVRKLRMKPPDQEQQAIDALLAVDTLVIDNLGVGGDTPFARQILQEVLDGRDFADRGGLIVTSQYSVATLARRLDDRSIPSRLAGMCRVIEIRGNDRRTFR
jgi:DNA replication protein DnaC